MTGLHSGHASIRGTRAGARRTISAACEYLPFSFVQRCRLQPEHSASGDWVNPALRRSNHQGVDEFFDTTVSCLRTPLPRSSLAQPDPVWNLRTPMEISGPIHGFDSAHTEFIEENKNKPFSLRAVGSTCRVVVQFPIRKLKYLRLLSRERTVRCFGRGYASVA